MDPTYRDRARIMREAARLHPWLTGAALLLSALGAALPLASIVATGYLVAAVPGAVRDGLDSPDGQRALAGLVALAVVLLVNRIAAPVRSTLGQALALSVDARVEERLMRAVNAPEGIAHLEEATTLDRIGLARGASAAGSTAGSVVSAVIEKIPHWLQGLGAAVLVARFHWWLAILLLGAWWWATDMGRKEQLSLSRAARQTARAVRRSVYLRDLALTAGAAREIRVFGLAEWLIERFTHEWLAAMSPIWRERIAGNRALIVSALPVVVAQGAAYGLLGWAGAHGEVGLGDLALYAGAIATMGTALSTRGGADHSLAHGTVTLPALRELEETLLPAGPPTGRGATLPSRMIDGIRFEGVGYRYPGRDADALHALDLFIPAGKSLAIVGANGAGKTTLIKLLCAVYRPTAGRITVDGVDLASVAARDWRTHVSAIFQDFVQYPLPARDNVAFGAGSAGSAGTAGSGGGMPAAQLEEAARRAGADRIVDALPRGWDTVLSRQFGGTDLSGGEWQRIALARALVGAASGAELLILDEPTANLDVRAEAELYDRFLDITAGLTTVLISHRFSTVRRADRICVLEGGCVVEDGTHEALMQLGGRYAHLFGLQAARFVDAPADEASSAPGTTKETAGA